jgi:WD40 repeat protein
LKAAQWNIQNRYKGFEEWAKYQPWKVRWASWPPETPHKVLIKNIDVSYLTLAEIKGKRVIAAGCWDGTIQILNPETGKLICEPLKGHKDRITSVAAGMLGQKPLIVSGSWDKTIRVWDLERRRNKAIYIGSACYSVKIFNESTIIVGTTSGIVVLQINDHTWDDSEEFEWNPD